MALSKEFKLTVSADTTEFKKNLSVAGKETERFNLLNDQLILGVKKFEESLGKVNLNSIKIPKDAFASIPSEDFLHEFTASFEKASININEYLTTSKELDRASAVLSDSLNLTTKELDALSEVVSDIPYEKSTEEQLRYIATLNNFVATSNDQEKAIALVSVQIAKQANAQKEAAIAAEQSANAINQNAMALTNLKLVAKNTGEELSFVAKETDNSASFMERLAGFAAIVAGTVTVQKMGGFKYLADKVSDTVTVMGQLQVGAIKVSNVMKGTFGASLLGAAEAASILAPGLFLLGSAMENSENGFISATGTVIKFASILVTSVGGAIGFVMQLIGGFIQSIGEGMVRSLVEAEEKFKKFEVVMRQFTFVVSNFGKEAGPEVVGSLELWNEQLEYLVENSTFTREEIAKATKLMVAEGSILGLSVQQTTELLALSGDVAAATGNSFEDVTQQMLTAISQNAAAILGLGIDIREHNLIKSGLMKESGLLVEQLTKEEQVQVRLAAVFKKAKPLIGAAKDATESIAGAEKQLAKAANDLAVIYGEQATATRALILFKTTFLKLLLKLPNALVTFIGTMQDFVGTVLIIIGAIIKWTAGLFMLVLAYKFVTAALATYLGIHVTLLNIFTFTLRRIFPVIAILFTLMEAWKQLTKEGTAFAKNLNFVASNMRLFGSATKEANEEMSFFGRIAKLAVDIAKIAFTGLLQLILGIQVGILSTRKMFAKGLELDAMKLAISDLQNRIDELDDSNEEAFASIRKFGGGVAYAGEQLQQSGDRALTAAELLESFKKRVVAAADKINESFDKAAERQKVLGTEFDKALGSIIQTKKEIDAVFDGKGSELETARKLAEAQQRLFGFELQAQKLKIDTLKQLADENKNIRMQELRDSGFVVEAIKMEFAIKRETLEAQIKGVTKLGKLRKEEMELLEEARISLDKAEKAAIDASQVKDLKDSLGNLKDDLKNLEDQTKSLNLERAKQSMSVLQLIDYEKELSIASADTLQTQLESIGMLDERAQGIIDAYKEATEAKAEFAKSEISIGDLSIGDFKRSVDDAIEYISDGFENLDFESLSMSFADIDFASIEQGFSEAAQGLTSKIQKGIESITLEMIGTAIVESVKFAFRVVGSEFLNMFTDGLESLINLPKTMQESFNRLDEIVTKAFNELPGVIVKLVQSVPAIMQRIAQALPQVFQSIAAALPMIAKAFLDVVPVLFQAVLDALPMLVRALSQVFQLIIKQIPGLVAQLIEGLPAIITAILEEIPAVIASILQALPSIIENLLENIDKVVLALVEGLIAGMGDVVAAFVDFLLGGGVERIVIALIKAVPKIVVALVQGIVRGLIRAAKSIFSSLFGGGFKLPSSVTDLPKDIKNAAKGLMKGISKDASQLFQVKDLQDSVGKLDAGTAISNAIDDAIDSAVSNMQNAWINIREKFMQMVNYFRDVWLKFLSGFNTAINFLRTSFLNIGVTLSTAFKNLVSFGQSFRDSIAGAGQIFTDFGANIWNGFKVGLDGLGSFFTDMFNKLDPSNLFERIFRVDYKGKGPVENALGIDIPFLNFAQGGIVPGRAKVPGDSLQNDTVMAMLSPDEAIIPRSLMLNPDIAKAVMMILQGDVPKFGFGGVVGEAVGRAQEAAGDAGGAISDAAKDIGGKIAEAIKNFNPDFLWGLVKDKVFNEMMNKMFESNKFHEGGMIGGSGEVPMTGLAGEFVMNRQATANNLPTLQRMNAGAVGGGGNVTIENITINAKTNLDAETIKREVAPLLIKEIKRRTQDGEYVISSRGVRA